VLKAITIVPLVESVTAGRFRVWLTTAGGTDLVWCRKRDGGFPELKVLVSLGTLCQVIEVLTIGAAP